jgi:hypothetical protein
MTMGRRAFLKLAGSTMACACAGAVGISGCALAGAAHTPAAPESSYRREGDKVIVTLSAAGELAAVGGAVRAALDGGEAKLIVVHKDRSKTCPQIGTQGHPPYVVLCAKLC